MILAIFQSIHPLPNYGHRVKWSILLSENRLLTILMCGAFPPGFGRGEQTFSKLWKRSSSVLWFRCAHWNHHLYHEAPTNRMTLWTSWPKASIELGNAWWAKFAQCWCSQWAANIPQDLWATVHTECMTQCVAVCESTIAGDVGESWRIPNFDDNAHVDQSANGQNDLASRPSGRQLDGIQNAEVILG